MASESKSESEIESSQPTAPVASEPLIIDVQMGIEAGLDVCWKPNMEIWGATKQEFLLKWQACSKDQIDPQYDDDSELKAAAEDQLSLSDWMAKLIVAQDDREDSKIQQIGEDQYWQTRTRPTIAERQQWTCVHPKYGSAFVYEFTDKGSKAIENKAQWTLNIMMHSQHPAVLVENIMQPQIGYLPGGTETCSVESDSDDDDEVEEGEETEGESEGDHQEEPQPLQGNDGQVIPNEPQDPPQPPEQPQEQIQGEEFLDFDEFLEHYEIQRDVEALDVVL